MRLTFNVEGLYYQNDIESQHVFWKCIQEYKKREDDADAEEVRPLCGTVNFDISGTYERSCIQSSEWHRFVHGKTDLFSKPRNSGRKPCYQELPKYAEPDVIIDRHESIADSGKQQNIKSARNTLMIRRAKV